MLEEKEVRDIDECDKEEFGTLDSRSPIYLGRWWPHAAKQGGGKISRTFLCIPSKQRNERLNVGGVSSRSRNGGPSRKGCVVNGQMTKASNKGVRPFPSHVYTRRRQNTVAP